MPGLPGFFPLSISSPQVTAPRSGGPARLSSILSALRCSAASHFPACSTPIHPSTRSSPNRDDDESDNLAPFNAYPNAYGVKPGHDGVESQSFRRLVLLDKELLCLPL